MRSSGMAEMVSSGSPMAPESASDTATKESAAEPWNCTRLCQAASRAAAAASGSASPARSCRAVLESAATSRRLPLAAASQSSARQGPSKSTPGSATSRTVWDSRTREASSSATPAASSSRAASSSWPCCARGSTKVRYMGDSSRARRAAGVSGEASLATMYTRKASWRARRNSGAPASASRRRADSFCSAPCLAMRHCSSAFRNSFCPTRRADFMAGWICWRAASRSVLPSRASSSSSPLFLPLSATT
mmetsp:Transcript_26373/g.74213  ORF Transcript_26373/g.74213 Transcript_26373/m.74213 type:complete len:249 (-) Transcript_26373:78-824(-)